jgi:hypothetical protein
LAAINRLQSPARNGVKVRPGHHGGGSGVWHFSIVFASMAYQNASTLLDRAYEVNTLQRNVLE